MRITVDLARHYPVLSLVSNEKLISWGIRAYMRPYREYGLTQLYIGTSKINKTRIFSKVERELMYVEVFNSTWKLTDQARGFTVCPEFSTHRGKWSVYGVYYEEVTLFSL